MSRGTTLEKKKRKFMQEADAFVGQLARDLYVVRYGEIGSDADPTDAMRDAVAYFQALQAFSQKAATPPAPPSAPVDANGSPVELEG